jgi:hypothetical protein
METKESLFTLFSPFLGGNVQAIYTFQYVAVPIVGTTTALPQPLVSHAWCPL